MSCGACGHSTAIRVERVTPVLKPRVFRPSGRAPLATRKLMPTIARLRPATQDNRG